MRGASVAKVLASKNDRVKEGGLVTGFTGWTEVAILDGKSFEVVELPKGAEVTDAVGCLGMLYIPPGGYRHDVLITDTFLFPQA